VVESARRLPQRTVVLAYGFLPMGAALSHIVSGQSAAMSCRSSSDSNLGLKDRRSRNDWLFSRRLLTFLKPTLPKRFVHDPVRLRTKRPSADGKR
jgi:hypothetical protein